MRFFGLFFLLLPLVLADRGYLDEMRILETAKSLQIHDIYSLLNITYGWPLSLKAVGLWNVDKKKWGEELTEHFRKRQRKSKQIGLKQLAKALQKMNITLVE